MSLSVQVRSSPLLVLAFVAACGGTEPTDRNDDPKPSDIEIAGSWDDEYGGTIAISNTTWGGSAITKYDNTKRFAITQNPADAKYSPGKFNKNVWTAPSAGTFYYCTVDFAKDTAADAEATTKTADANDLTGAGCGGFPWSKLVPEVPKIAVIGTWDDSWGFTTTITKDKWGDATITKFDNTKRFAVTQNPADAGHAPGKFNKNVWTAPQGNTFYYCTVDFSLDTAAAAENTTKTADENDLTGAGCGGFPWTKLVAHSPFEVAGTWDEQFADEPTVITASTWGASTVTKYNNAARYAIVKSPSNAQWNPDTYAKLVWTPVESGTFFYCMIDFAKATADDAENTTNVADPSDPSVSGCGQFSWTKMTAKTN